MHDQSEEHLIMGECTSRQGASATGELSPNITAQHADISVKRRKHGKHTTNVLCTLWRGPTYEDDVMMCYSLGHMQGTQILSHGPGHGRGLEGDGATRMAGSRMTKGRMHIRAGSHWEMTEVP